MTLPALVTVVLFAATLLTACQSPNGARARSAPATSLNNAPVATPEPLDAWEGGGTFAHHLSRENNIYFAGQPNAQALRDAGENGIATVINLRTPPETTPDRLGFDEAAVVESAGLRYVGIPFKGPSLSLRDADLLADTLRETPADESVLIHCGSSNRVGALWALYLASHRGVPIDEAVAQGRAAGMHSPALEERVRALASRP